MLKLLAKLQFIWEEWNLRGFILFSFSLQCILIIGSSLRIQTSRPWVHRVIWLVYLLADWAAYYAIGLVVPINRLKDVNTYDIHSFWAPFLLLHIGGPNTIAGFSLQDNELWDRSVLHIAVQAGATVIAIVRSLSKKRLLAPTLLVFLAAFTRYVGRILALYKGSLDYSLRDSVSNRPQEGTEDIPETDLETGPETEPEPEPKPELAMVAHSYELFQKFKGIFCGLSMETPTPEERLYTLKPMHAFNEMEIELGLAYGLFYTKIWTIIEDRGGRILHLVSLASEVAALFFWVLANKHVYHEVDVKLTNALLFGGVFLDMVSMLKLLFSDLVICRLYNLFPDSRPVASALNMVLSAKNHRWAKGLVLFRRWSGSIKQFNLMEYTVRPCCGSHRLRELLDGIIGRQSGVSIVKLTDDLNKQIFRSIRDRARYARAKKPSGVLLFPEYAREMFGDEELLANAMEQICRELEVVNALIIWHIVTQLFYRKWKHEEPQEHGETIFRKCNKQLSQYLMYLLFHQPKMILEGVQRLDMTVEDMKKYLKEIKEKVSDSDLLKDTPKWDAGTTQAQEAAALKEQKDYIDKLLGKVKGKGSVILIFELASYIVKKLPLCVETEAIMCEIWMDLLLNAAVHCGGRNHVEQLGKGGELLTIVWLMTTHLHLTIKLPSKHIVG